MWKLLHKYSFEARNADTPTGAKRVEMFQGTHYEAR